MPGVFATIIIWNFLPIASNLKMMLIPPLLATVCLLVSCLSKPKYPAGGYNYPDKTTRIDTNDYAFPVRDVISTRDSFHSVYYERYWYKSYDEPNLSIKPWGEDIFRMTFKSAFGDGAIITLLENKIISKQRIKGDPYPEYDSTKLTPLERHFYELLYWNFPIQSLNGERRKRLDSIADVYPQILDPVFYRDLLDKSRVPNKNILDFTTKEIPISKRKYYRLIDHINSSGYWTMPYKTECEGYSIADGYIVFLEANTSRKYNLVTGIGCPSDEMKFIKVCQEIIDAANLNRPINILPDK